MNQPTEGSTLTELQKLYTKQRVEGRGHYAAIRAVARETGLDNGTVERSLKRAEGEYARKRS